MTRPELGEVITARFPGTCVRSGQRYEAGAQIARSADGYHLADRAAPEGDIKLHGGSGYGCDGWEVGQVVWHAEYDRESNTWVNGQPVMITSAGSTYYREDGLSFGVGDDCGRVYRATARPATPEEAAPLLAEREAARLARTERTDLERGVRALAQAEDHDTPKGGSLRPEGRRLKIGEGFTLYGGGEELVLDADGQHLWHLQNNGGDGDNWGSNNVRTGGAGAIGRRFPLTDERRAWVDRHWPDAPIPATEAPATL